MVTTRYLVMSIRIKIHYTNGSSLLGKRLLIMFTLIAALKREQANFLWSRIGPEDSSREDLAKEYS